MSYDDIDDLDADPSNSAPPKAGHNSKPDGYDVAADELRSFVERYEQLEADKKEISEQQKEVMAEAKGRGYDTKIIKKVVALRKRKADEIAEEQAILDMYCRALGLDILL